VRTSYRPLSQRCTMGPASENTDWPQILALYELLKRMSDNPMVMLNHGIAAAMVHARRQDSICWMRWRSMAVLRASSTEGGSRAFAGVGQGS
jgi:hypothetical protein